MTTRVAGGRSVGHTPCGCRSHPLSVKDWLKIPDTTREAAGDDGDTLKSAAHPQLSSPQPPPRHQFTNHQHRVPATAMLNTHSRTHGREGPSLLPCRRCPPCGRYQLNSHRVCLSPVGAAAAAAAPPRLPLQQLVVALPVQTTPT
eukprot:GHVU01181985.1.p1 GENE.GHVU01181985.1~~GHVU01181985.1.p1  ORF type:complete len:145 (-),score=6.99 GHVU01181985.1:62-496(-)